MLPLMPPPVIGDRAPAQPLLGDQPKPDGEITSILGLCGG